MGRLWAFLTMAVGLLLLPTLAMAEKRVALVIGNGTYQDAATLANPVNDVLDLAAKLRGIGFEVVEGHDLGKRELERKIGDFADALAGADVGMFYYAGHGIQIDGRNYIIPVDARLDQAVKLRLEAVPIDEVLDIMEQQTKVSLIFLDACRNNPYTRSFAGSSRSAVPIGGLSQINSPHGSFIAYSTTGGAVAMDGAGRNSPFAEALINHIATPGQSIGDMMVAVRRDVIKATNGSQSPAEYGSLLERFEFVPATGPVVAAAPTPPPAPLQAEPQVQVATTERSLGGSNAIESMLRDDYLVPKPNSLSDMVRRLYVDQASIFGSKLPLDAIVKAKTDWFGLYSGWSLAMLPDTLAITPRGETRADVVFDMSYDYLPKDKAQARQTGKARVRLGLVAADGAWKIDSESSEYLP